MKCTVGLLQYTKLWIDGVTHCSRPSEVTHKLLIRRCGPVCLHLLALLAMETQFSLCDCFGSHRKPWPFSFVVLLFATAPGPFLVWRVLFVEQVWTTTKIQRNIINWARRTKCRPFRQIGTNNPLVNSCTNVYRGDRD